MRIRLLVVGALGSTLLVSTPALAGVYQALCSGGSECTVTLGNGKIGMPGLSIERNQVLSWSQGGSGTQTDVGMGVGAVVLFGLPGLIGFGAKKHDYQFSINYVDSAGNIQVATVAFKNNVPANQFMMELMGMTGLTVGEVNQALQTRIDEIQAQAAEKERIAALDCARVLKPYGCSWSAYLAANPSVQVWSQKYPQLVPAEKARLRAID